MRARTGGLPAILGIGFLAVFGTIATAQQPSSTRITSTGQPQSTTSTRLVNATVVSVDGNNVVAEDASGHATQYTIPDGFKFQFEGRDIGVAELKPGMHVSATVTTTTTTTPVYVTEIKTGKVLVVSGHSIIVRGPQGNRVFSNKDAEQRDVTVMRSGQKVSLSDLRAGDNFTAVIVSDEARGSSRRKRSRPWRTRRRRRPARSSPHGGRGRRTRGGPHGSRRRRTRFRPDGDLRVRSRRDSRGSPRDGLIHGHRSRPGDGRDAETVSDLAPDRPGRRDPARRVSPPAPPRTLTEASWNRCAAGLRGRRLRPPPTREGSRLRWPYGGSSRDPLLISGFEDPSRFRRPGAEAHFPA